MIMPTDTVQREMPDSSVSCENAQGVELHATLLKLTRFQAAFQVYSPSAVLRLSEVLQSFKILLHGHLIYSGRAVVSNLIQFGSALVCEVTLDEACLDLTLAGLVNNRSKIQAAFAQFLEKCGKNFRVRSEFKVVVADMQMFFLDARLWMEQMELGVRSQPAGDRLRLEREVLLELERPILPAVAPLLEKFELLANQLEPDVRSAHRAYMKRQIHPVVLCSPFLYRTFQKPLGYAGDYEMVNMMVRDPFEGASMFAKLVNRIFLDTPPVVAHRNRVTYLTRRLLDETRRAAAQGRTLRVLNVGCGPAKEMQDFLAQHELADLARFTLLDFNEETLSYTAQVLKDLKAAHHRSTGIQTIRKSVHHLLKDAGKPSTPPLYDLIYCAGLFDYLSDQVCKRLMSFLYELLAPGGLLLGTNVSTTNPSRNWMEYVLDWHLVYRSADELSRLAPERAPADTASVQAIGDAVNIALEVRKPSRAG